MKLSIRNLTKRFGAIAALKGISLEIPSGSFACFLGPSGCGKTTLLRVIAGLEAADEGEVLLGTRDLSRVPARSRNFGVVFQSYSLFPNMTAARNVGYGLECRGRPKAEIAERVSAMLRLVHLADHAGKLPSQLSGGQQQRVALARALAVDPALLLLDEPLSALDAKVREELRMEITALKRRLGITTIMVTHDQEEALTMADLIVVMRDGAVEQVGSPTELYAAPATPFVAGFIGRMNLIAVAADDRGELVFAGKPLRWPGNGTPPRTLGIRPEEVELREADSAGDNVVSGSVLETVYLGNIVRLVVVPDGAEGTPLTVERHGARALLPVGARVGLRLPSEALKPLA